jgi:hypothetical protein
MDYRPPGGGGPDEGKIAWWRGWGETPGPEVRGTRYGVRGKKKAERVQSPDPARTGGAAENRSYLQQSKVADPNTALTE